MPEHRIFTDEAMLLNLAYDHETNMPYAQLWKKYDISRGTLFKVLIVLEKKELITPRKNPCKHGGKMENEPDIARGKRYVLMMSDKWQMSKRYINKSEGISLRRIDECIALYKGLM